jgi:hypothetical protein
MAINIVLYITMKSIEEYEKCALLKKIQDVMYLFLKVTWIQISIYYNINTGYSKNVIT